MKVSVILTTHGEGKYLGQAIASVLAQTFQDFELLIAFDGYSCSNDFLDERIRAFGFHDVTAVNRYAHTINQAFKETKGDYITYLCHDDLYLPWRLEAMARTLDANPDVHVVYGQQQMMEERGGVTFLTGVRDTVGVTKDAPFHVDHSSVMHRRECFEKVGGWDENAPMRSGDAFFWARLHKAGYAFYPIEAPLDCHRYNDQSVSYLIDHEVPMYPPYDDLGNKRTIKNAVDCDYSAIDK
jgi:glycosyltransferase involved in cell wall biosynthesis